MTATNAQVRKFMDEMAKHQMLGVAAARAGMDRKTAAKYRDAGKFPSEMGVIRDWRTREDPFDADWAEVERRLVDAPELEAKTSRTCWRMRPKSTTPGSCGPSSAASMVSTIRPSSAAAGFV